MSADESYVLRIDTTEVETAMDIQEELDKQLRSIDKDRRRVRNTTCTTYSIGARTYLIYTFVTEEIRRGSRGSTGPRD